jgi:inorganic pyrophosphatase
MRKAFWKLLDALIKSSELVIDRPKGSQHPRFPSVTYPLAYGYLKETSGGDRGGIDVWRGSLPEWSLAAVVCTVDILNRDAEVKLLIGCSQAEKRTIVEFHSSEHTSAILVEREENNERR